MESSPSQKRLNKTVHVFTDVGVKDIDDELLLKYLANNKVSLDILIIFMGSDGISPTDALAHWVRTYEANVLLHLTPGTKISYSVIQEYAAMDRAICDYALQISPLNGFDGHNMIVKEKYIFAGDYITSEGARSSFNRSGSGAILDKFYKEGKLVDIPSAHMVKMRFNEELLSKFDGPFKNSIVFTGFLLIFARMSPTHSANKFAEGLINPDVGRGANYHSVMKMKDVFGIDEPGEMIPRRVCTHNYEWRAAKNYCSCLEENGVILKDREGTINCLTDMNIILQLISDKDGEHDIFDIEGSVFVSDFDVNSVPDKLIPAWEFFKANSEKLTECFNPVYDLFAGYVMMGYIHDPKDENRVNHDVDEFCQNVCMEF
jgi:hypothetical protein